MLFILIVYCLLFFCLSIWRIDYWRWWWTGRPGVLRFMGSQRVRHDWTTELKWTELRNSLVVQWLVLSVSTARGLGLIPDQGTEISHEPQGASKKKNNKKNLDCWDFDWDFVESTDQVSKKNWHLDNVFQTWNISPFILLFNFFHQRFYHFLCVNLACALLGLYIYFALF